MKRFVTTIAAVFLISIALAQKPMAECFTLETQLNFQTGTAPVNIFTPNLRVRYFITDELAARLQFAFLSEKSVITVTENADGTGGDGSATLSSSQFTFRPGIEKHFTGTNRLDPYIGAEINIQIANAKETWDQADFDGFDYYYEEGTTLDLTGGWAFMDPTWSAGSTIGVNVLGGFDFYITEHLYLGGELGWGFYSFNGKDAEATEVFGGNTFTYISTGDNMSGFMMLPSGFVRIGWTVK